MKTDTAISEASLEVNQTKQLKTLFITFFWLIALIIFPQLSLGIFLGTIIDIQPNLSSSPNDSTRLSLILLISLLSPIITIPILYKVTNKECLQDCLNFWAIYNVNSKGFIKYSIIALLFWIGTFVLSSYLNLPIEPFVLNVKNSMDNALAILLAVITICLIMPIMEELIFRGWLFSEIAQTKLGNIGALFLTSFIFTMIHGQYNYGSTIIMLFFLGLLLGYIRHKSNNLSYAVFVHILFNSLTMAALFFL
jgi:membrane protease YdiL (CAAX protease family)